MFGETTISYVKIGNHPIETTIYKWLFGVPGIYVYIPIQCKLFLITLHFTSQTTSICRYSHPQIRSAHTYISILGCFFVFNRGSQGLYWSWYTTDYTQLLFLLQKFIKHVQNMFMFTCRISGHIQVHRWLSRNKSLESTPGGSPTDLVPQETASSRIGIVNWKYMMLVVLVLRVSSL